jgi:hypothetical protein
MKTKRALEAVALVLAVAAVIALWLVFGRGLA